MFLNDVHYLSLSEVDLMGVLATVVRQNTVLLQILHLIWMRDNCLCCCRWEEEGGREGGREGGWREGGGREGGWKEGERGR